MNYRSKGRCVVGEERRLLVKFLRFMGVHVDAYKYSTQALRELAGQRVCSTR